ncbi:MAG TPA: STAS domain-containing protein [Spirochaetota bacterium]|nr:STAS domain-containing protein [Spirochaetota bacterium]
MEIKTSKKEKWFVVYLEGRLDVVLSQQLENMINEKIEEGENYILYNLDKVEYMSSSGLRVFIATMRKLKEKNGAIRLCNVNNSVKKILKIVDLEGMFDIFASEQEALAE